MEPIEKYDDEQESIVQDDKADIIEDDDDMYDITHFMISNMPCIVLIISKNHQQRRCCIKLGAAIYSSSKLVSLRKNAEVPPNASTYVLRNEKHWCNIPLGHYSIALCMHKFALLCIAKPIIFT